MKAKLGRKTKVCLLIALGKAMCAKMRCKISLFLEDWELAKVAFSCHMALDMLCQQMNEASLSGDATERPGMSVVLSPWTG